MNQVLWNQRTHFGTKEHTFDKMKTFKSQWNHNLHIIKNKLTIKKSKKNLEGG
jgi:hypothetical protein